MKAYASKALIVRGEMVGYKAIKALLEQQHNSQEFKALMSKVILGKVSKHVTKENGFEVLNKLWAQRLFTTLFPVISGLNNAHLMMTLCSSVSLSFLENQGKLQELLPTAHQALKDTADLSIKLTSISLFRKILIQAAESENEQKQKGLVIMKTVVPDILSQLSLPYGTDAKSTVHLKLECLHSIHQLIEKYPQPELHACKVEAHLKPLLEDKKRVIRKFARTCLSDLQN